MKARRDFIFIDETGDPGKKGTPYYICTLFHVTDAAIMHLYSAVCTYRFMLDHYHEMHGHNLSLHRSRKLNKILSKSKKYFNCSVVMVSKESYKGPYLDRYESKRNPVLFRKFIYRQVLNFHFSKHKPLTKHLEIVLDRSNLSQSDFNNLRGYIYKYGNCPNLEIITEVDSKYVELLQLADVLGRQFVGKISGDPTETEGFDYNFINYKDITLENALGDKW